jgi:hypothetical protein
VDDVGDRNADGSWMTYREIAAARRVKLSAAVRLVQRHKWRKHTGNDGTARILVPTEWVKPSDRVTPDVGHDVVPDTEDDVADDVTPDRHMLAGALAALEDAISALREQLEQANERADRAETRADDLRAQINTLNAETVVMRSEANRAFAAAKKAEAEIDQLRGEAEAAQIAQAKAEADAAGLRQAEEEQRATADALRERADELQAGQELMMDMHARSLAAAQEQLEQVREAAEGLRQAEADRKARGLLARLRAALRGRRDGGGG